MRRSSSATRDPQLLSAILPLAPPALDRIVNRCLAKDPDERWQTAADLWSELRWLVERGSTERQTDTGQSPKATNRERLAWTLVAVFGVVSVAAPASEAVAYVVRAPVDTQTTRFFISPPDGWSLTPLTPGTNTSPASLTVSPDGRRVAFLASNAGGRNRLWVRSLDTLTAQELAGTDGAFGPFWSPDSRFLGFFADGKLKKIEVSGGPPITLADAGSDDGGGTWSRDGVIIFRGTQELQKVSASGGVPTTAIVPQPGDSMRAAVSLSDRAQTRDIWLVDLGARPPDALHVRPGGRTLAGLASSSLSSGSRLYRHPSRSSSIGWRD